MGTAPPLPPRRRTPAWILPTFLAIVLGLGIWYVLTKGGAATPSDNANGLSNATVLPNNTNAVTNTTSSVPLSSITFSNLSLQYPAAWAAQGISGAPDCRGFTSPELSAYNRAFANAHPDTPPTDAVVAYDVTVCNQGTLSGSLQAAADRWIAQSGADNVSPAHTNDPFTNALRYQISSLSVQDIVFFQANGYLIRASLPVLPYPHPETNTTYITALLESVK